MPFNFTNCEAVSFKESPLNDVAGDYHVTNNSTTDNRNNCGNTINRNISGSYNDSSMQDNRKGNLFNKANYAVESRVATDENLPPGADGATGKMPIPRGIVTERGVGARDSSNTLKLNGRGRRVIDNHLPEDQATQKTPQRRLETPCPAQNPESVTAIPNGRASPASSSSEDRMEVDEIPKKVVCNEPSAQGDPALGTATQEGNTTRADAPRKKIHRMKRFFHKD